MAKILFILLLFFNSPLSGADPIQVEVVGESSEGVSASSDTQVFSEAEVENSASSDLGQFLRTKGFSIQRQGGDGQSSSLYLRGSDPDQVLVLVDGVPVNDPSNTDRRFDFSRIPLTEIRRVEVLKGAQSVRYGSQALGGVVRIWTKASEEKRKYSLGLRAGSFEAHEESVSLTQPLNSQFYLGVSGQNFESGGFSSASGGREDDGHRSQSGSASLGFSNEVLKSQYAFRRTNQLTDNDRGGGELNDDPNYLARFRQDTHSLINNYSPNNDTSFELLLGLTKIERHVDDQPDASSAATEFGNYLGEQRRLQISLDRQVFSKANASFGLEYVDENAEGVSSFSVFPKSQANKKSAFFAYDQEYDRFLINFGFRYEDHSEFGNDLSHEFGAGYHLTENQNLKLRVAQATKWPSLFELYDPTFGNPELDPEKSTSLELGWEYRANRWSLATTLFENRYKNLITGAPPTYRSINNGRARIRGLELDYQLKIQEWQSGLHYQYLEPRQTDRDVELPRRSRHEIYASETYQKENWSAGLWLKYNSRREDPIIQDYLSEFWIWGADASYQFENLRLWASAENLNQKTYEEVAGYRAPPRTYWIGINAAY